MTDATQSREAVEALAADLDELGVDVIDVVLDPEHRAEQLETTRRSPETGSGRDPCSERFERD
jgi:hypothetical protein